MSRAHGWPPTTSTGPRPASGQPEPPGCERTRESVQQNRAERDDEDDRQHELATGDALLRELKPERGGGRPGHDPSRRHQRDECPLARRDPRAPGCECDRDGSEDDHDDEDERERLRHHGSDVVGRDRGGDEHEQDADEQLDERLFELERQRDIDYALIAENDAHQ